MRAFIAIIAGSLLVSACGDGGEAGAGEEASGAALPFGVYECDSATMVGGVVMPNPEPAVMFGVLGPGRYRHFDGGEGRFALTDHVLSMTSGPLEGTRYRQDPEMETYFQVLDASGEPDGTRCLLNPAKDINGTW